MPRLIVIKGADEGRQFDLTDPVIAVGRHSGNPIHLHDTQVSRRHLELRAGADGRYQLVDLGSGNGTLVNGRQVGSHDLRPGDQIALGETVLLFVDDQNAPGEDALSPPDQSGIVRLSTAPASGFASGIVRTVREDAGSRILTNPDQVNTDWLRTRLANLAVLYEAANVVSHILDVDELLGRIADLVLRAADADHGCFMLRDTDTGELMPKAVRCRPGLVDQEFVVSRTIIEHVLREREGVLVSDAAADDRFRGGESIVRHNIREVICVPMRGRHETVGVLFLDTLAPFRAASGAATLKFTDDHLHLAVAVAHQAALAVEETRYYQALVNAERLAAVGQTIAALSHHIKNIMQGVRFGGDMVRSGLETNDRELLVKGWKLVEKNQGRIDELILDMLSYSKEREPAIESTNLVALIVDVLEVVRGRADEAGISLVVDMPAGLPPVPCDPDGIHRALLNVVSNALDAVEGRNDPRVEVTMRLTDGGSWAEVIVADNGPGIPTEKQEDIFRPFVSTKGSRGTGLGLPVSRKVLREHGGNLIALSEPGQGTRFVFRLPMRLGEKNVPD
jgi:signal transduction histidine kinase